MSCKNASPFELARLERISELFRDAKLIKIDCSDLAALEHRILSLERGLSAPSRDCTASHGVHSEAAAAKGF